MTKKDYNERMIGKVVTVITDNKSWSGTIEGVIDDDTLTIRDNKNGKINEISIFDIRQE